ncbi:methylmalonyl-CoA mutase family protein [Desulfuromonas sp. AOP6]|uniref:acyl-CoA mutase large subunit family protein n=1 Tax=Desulfuromonas sp. AOP6 TaxID=1566351 RepID=UPI00127D407E|nr:methylmalonyl-CoA mutase family protein [Desulfuromonas sp. AOP6]BCA81119.1 methylmalonyl-CoA mutase [Desulfuromonas sp. AOP6]
MSIQDQKKHWEATTLKKVIDKAKERREDFSTTSGLEMERVFLPDFEWQSYEEKLGLPGEYPYTRGVQPTMYRGRFWTMRQYAGFGTAKESNERYRYLLGAGQTGLSVAFDLPTQMGYDSDDAMAEGEVGKVGVAIDTLADMETLFDQIPLDKVSTSMTINASAAVLLAMYIAVAEKQGVSSDKIMGTIQNDILKEYMARGTYIYPPSESMRIITDIFAYCKDHVPKWNTISISGYHIREAGSSAVQEVAFTLADGIAYVEAAIKAGLDVDEFAPRLAFFFNAHNNLLEEVAKFRAARRIWAKIMKERFGAKDPRSQMLRFHTQTAGCTLTAQQPDNNIMRVTIQALAAVLGGTQSLHTNSRDEALALPTEDSVRIALRTQQVIAYESGVADSIDPLAGSFLVESLTDQMEAKALEYIQKIDDLGGAAEAINRGFQQKEIQDSAYAYQRAIERKEQIIVGVNQFTVKEAPPKDLLKIKPEVERAQLKAIAAVKTGRDQQAVEARLAALKTAAQGTENLMPPILEAVRAYASLGEICNTLRDVFGEHQETVVL